jgi:hypothetical protein
VVVLGGDVAGEGQRAERLADPGDHVEVLDRDRHPDQRRELARAAGLGDGLLGPAGLVAGEVGGDRVEGPDLGVQPLDAVQVMTGDLGG